MTAIVKYFGQNRISQQFLLSKKSIGTNKYWMKSVTEKGRFLTGFEQRPLELLFLTLPPSHYNSEQHIGR